MATIRPEIISQFGDVQNQIWQTVTLTVSEASNTAITFTPDKTVAARPTEIQPEAGSPMLVVQYSFANLPESVQVVLIPQDTFVEFAGTIKNENIEEVDDGLVSDCRPSIEAIVQGICMSVGNLKNEAIVASGLSIRYQMFTMPVNLQKSDELVRVELALSGGDQSFPAIWLLDDEAAMMILGIDTTSDDDSSSPFAQVSAEQAGPGLARPQPAYEDTGLELLLDIPLEISVELGRVRMMVKEVVELGTGSIVEIDKAAGEPVDVMVNGRLVAKGEVVVIEDNFGVRITEILTPQERLARLGEVA
ncbi:MAG: flagellar motor switch protein FliN [Fimbriimonadaceae bacterium]|nr:flagellar motor switch protein FliN [Fimbriimonadaceae bacterium]